MKLRRRQFQQLAASALALPAVPRLAAAQAYPAQPVRLVVGFAAGQAIDILARLIAQSLSEQFSQQFIVENKPGAGGNIAAESVARAPADGYTLLVIGANNPINSTLYDKLGFDLLRDFAPVAGIYRVYQVMEVNPAFPAQDRPRVHRLRQGPSGKDQLRLRRHRLGGARHRRVVQDDGRHRHAARALSRRAARPGRPAERPGAGHVRQPAVVDRSHQGGPPARARRIDARRRSSCCPACRRWPSSCPASRPAPSPASAHRRACRARSSTSSTAGVNTALADPKLKARILDLGGVPMPMTPAEFGRFLAAETEKWAKVIRAANIKPG